MSTIGIAMIARNAAEAIPQVLEPFNGHVDKIVSVLGGKSADKTANVAAIYGQVAVFDGPVDEQGRLMDFGRARQQSFEMLDTDWALVIDTDDIWQSPELTRLAVEEAEEIGANRIFVPYHLGQAAFTQPRLYRLGTGHWTSPVHNHWIPDDPAETTLTVGQPQVRQKQRSGEARQARLEQSIAIAEAWLPEHPNDLRLLSHLVRDYMTAGNLERAVEVSGWYTQQIPDDYDNRDEFYYLLFNRGMATFHLGRLQDAYNALIYALTVRNYGPAWGLLAEVMYATAEAAPDHEAMCKMAIMCADQALRCGRPRSAAFPVNPLSVTSWPLAIKAKALARLGRDLEALAAIEAALMIDPGQEGMQSLKRSLCHKLEVAL
jgi:tetratricopeptide (TPR) repeat protein